MRGGEAGSKPWLTVRARRGNDGGVGTRGYAKMQPHEQAGAHTLITQTTPSGVVRKLNFTLLVIRPSLDGGRRFDSHPRVSSPGPFAAMLRQHFHGRAGRRPEFQC